MPARLHLLPLTPLISWPPGLLPGLWHRARGGELAQARLGEEPAQAGAQPGGPSIGGGGRLPELPVRPLLQLRPSGPPSERGPAVLTAAQPVPVRAHCRARRALVARGTMRGPGARFLHTAVKIPPCMPPPLPTTHTHAHAHTRTRAHTPHPTPSTPPSTHTTPPLTTPAAGTARGCC